MLSHRRHDIDALRVVLLGLLILFHIASLYTGWDWFLSSTYHSHLVSSLAAPLHLWRMDLLFMISGLAINFMRRDSHVTGPEIFQQRSVRLLIPLLFGLVFLVPVQPYCQAVWHHRIEPGFGAFLWRYFFGPSWPAGTFYGVEDRYALGQLWYLLYLWLYTAVLVLAFPLLDSALGSALRGWVTRLRGLWFLIVPALGKLASASLLSHRFAGREMLMEDWTHHLEYSSFFVLGYLVGTNEGFWNELMDRRWLTLVLSAAGWPLTVIAGKLGHQAGSSSIPWATVTDTFAAFDTWFWVAAALGWSAVLLNRPFKWLPYASQAIFPWYLLHQTLIVGTAFVLVPKQLGPVLEPALIVLITVLGCGLLHEYVIRRNHTLRLLFGIKDRRTGRRMSSQPPPVLTAGSESPRPAETSAD